MCFARTGLMVALEEGHVRKEEIHVDEMCVDISLSVAEQRGEQVIWGRHLVVF